MNIFLTSDCPQACAVALDDKRVVKMALETAQLLATALHSERIDIGYKATHYNHPCSIWARKNRPNFSWLIEHGLWLCDEYKFRYGREHKCLDIIKQAFPHRTAFTDNVPLSFTFNCSGYDTGDVFNDYQLCMINKWTIKDTNPRWTARGKPAFLKQFGKI